MDGWIAEVFSGIQGEGPYVGCRHLFVRLAGCNWRCVYCDTPEARDFVSNGRAENSAGKRDFFFFTNPLSSILLLDYISNLKPQLHQAVSFTGGEPLIQESFLGTVLPYLKDEGIKIYLETNGTLPGAFERVMSFVDITALDFKLESSTGIPPEWDAHTRFLELAAQETETFVKIVVTSKTSLWELEKVVSIIAAVDPETTLVIQPVTRHGDEAVECSPPSPEQVLFYQDYAMNRLKDVRVIPQVHRLMGQL